MCCKIFIICYFLENLEVFLAGNVRGGGSVKILGFFSEVGGIGAAAFSETFGPGEAAGALTSLRGDRRSIGTLPLSTIHCSIKLRPWSLIASRSSSVKFLLTKLTSG